jgi:hypothetical protein
MSVTVIDKNRIKELPIFFIVGRERSGTTLLRTLFDAHPNVSIPVEFHFIWQMYNKYHRHKTWTIQQLEKFYNELIRLPRFHLLTIDKEKLHHDLISLIGETDYSTICKVVLANYISFFDKNDLLMLGDKCPVYAVYIKQILSVFPEAHVLHLTRDYRDNVLSMLRVNIESHVFSSLVSRWKYYNSKVNDAKKVFPDSFMTIRYEDFVSDPAVYLEKICNFMGLPYNQDVLQFYEKKEDYLKKYPRRIFETGVHSNLFKPITADNIYGWRKKMPSSQVKLADSIIGASAEFWGYQREYHKRNWGLLLLHWPGLAFGTLYYFWGNFVSYLPLGFKIKLLHFLARIYKQGWKRIKAQTDANGKK